jgi:hypothetical protein
MAGWFSSKLKEAEQFLQQVNMPILASSMIDPYCLEHHYQRKHVVVAFQTIGTSI